MFGGRLSEDFIADKVGHSNFTELLELDFPQSSIQSVILSDGQLFNNLRRSLHFCFHSIKRLLVGWVTADYQGELSLPSLRGRQIEY